MAYNRSRYMLILTIIIYMSASCMCRRRRFKRGEECNEDIISMYEVSFFGDWSKKSYPKMYPRYRPHAQWSKLVGRTHDSTYILWREGKLASPTLQKFVEEGSSKLLDKDAQGFNGTYDSFSAEAIRNGVGRSTVRVVANGKYAKLSFIVKMVPSPDWFAGVDSVDLCRAGRWRRRIHMTMRPMDGGTDQGLTYTSPNWPSHPQEPVHQILTTKPRHPASPFYNPDQDKLPRIAHVLIERIGEFVRRGKRKSSKFQDSINIFVASENPKDPTTTLETAKVITTGLPLKTKNYREETEQSNNKNDHSNILYQNKSLSSSQSVNNDKSVGQVSETHTPPLLTQSDDSSAIQDSSLGYLRSKRLEHGNIFRSNILMKTTQELQPSTDRTTSLVKSRKDQIPVMSSSSSHIANSPKWRSATQNFVEPTEPTVPAISVFRNNEGIRYGEDTTKYHGPESLDCLVTEWGAWGPCSMTCGFGRRMRKRQILQQPEKGGSACPRVSIESLCGSMRTCGWKHFSMFAQQSRRRRDHRMNSLP
ncbi:spondin-2 [Patella vulgata]|uniref:spondin-2 n=1 Tax=Patella vulgata TaxID=6465 RepID=UPI00217F6500|nr:spondin-2 [Patella vulgata]